jgi:hypothetical protein
MRRSYYGLMAVVFIAATIGLRCGKDKGTEPETPEYGVTPDSVSVEVSSTQQFVVEFYNVPGEATWYVDGIRGGNPRTGMITPDGFYIAPHEAPPGGYVTITARAELDSTVRETAKAVIRSGYGTPSLRVSPDSVTVVLGDSVAFSPAASGCPLADPSWSVVAVSPDSDPTGEVRANGTYLAPAAIPDDITLMVTVESPDCPGKKGIAKAVVRKPEMFVVQLEDFSDSSGIMISRATPCSGGGYAVNGLDQPGEWILVPYEIRAGGRYSAEIHYAAGVGDTLRVVVAEMGCPNSPSPVEVDFEMAQGDGLT